MFHQAELRLLAGALILFLSGLGWRAAHATALLPPLQVHGEVLDWTEPESVSPDTITPIVAATRPSKGPSSTSFGPLDPNTATREQLEALPGIGPSLAQRILDARAASPLRSLADLDRVKGFGPAKIEKIRPHLTF